MVLANKNLAEKMNPKETTMVFLYSQNLILKIELLNF